jgi:lipopolysaccharide/colanic/teichoic acid biosynthesis glycosyltransferase
MSVDPERSPAPTGRVPERTGNAPDARRTAVPLQPTPTRSVTKYERFLKPVLDRIGGVVLTLVSLPLVVVVALVIRVSMGSPVLFRQERVGHLGRLFTVYKFRTMDHDRRTSQVSYVGRDRRVNHKSPDDPRLTGVGRFLRRWSLDELPQFWNVAAGQMSLVGPRPELVAIVDRYEPWQHERHVVKPGITGPWQVSYRGAIPMHEATDVDVEYARNVTFLGDLRLLLLTVPTVLGLRKGH